GSCRRPGGPAAWCARRRLLRTSASAWSAPYDSGVTDERVIIVVRPRAILLTVALALLAMGFLVVPEAAAVVSARLLVAVVLACLLRPLTLRLARRMPLRLAAALTLLLVLIGFALVTAVEIRDLISETHHLKVAVPARIEQLRTELEPDHPV